MIKLNIHEAKTHLSHHLKKLARGEPILLCKRNVPIAEIRPMPRSRKSRRRVGLAKGKLKIPRAFFKPLPADVLVSFYSQKP